MAELYPKCSHKEFLNIKSDFSFCRDCGLLSYDSNKAVTPIHKNLKIEVDPLKLIGNLNKSQLPFLCCGERKLILPKLMRLIKHYNFSEATLYLSLDYTERVLSRLIISESKKDLVVLTCFLIAAKFGENDPYIPDYSTVSANWKAKDLRQMEDVCVKSLDYKLDNPTLYEILMNFLNIGIVFEHEFEQPNSQQSIKTPKSDENSDISKKIKKIFDYAKKLMKKVLEIDWDFSNNQNPYYLALAIIQKTRDKFYFDKSITESLIKLYSIDESSKKLSDCIKAIDKILEKERMVEMCSSLERVETEKNSPSNKLEIPIERRRYSVNKNLHSRRLSTVEINNKGQFIPLSKDMLSDIANKFEKNSGSSNASTCSNNSSTSVPKQQIKSTSSQNIVQIRMPIPKQQKLQLVNNNLRFPRASAFSNVKINTSENNLSVKKPSVSNTNLPAIKKENSLMFKYL